MIAAAIADVPGASLVLLGGVVSYAFRVKREVLGVRGLGEEQAVSRDCAQQMAAGAQKLLRADLAVSATGVAGPDGGTAETPAGTVWIGLVCGETITAREHHFTGDRQAVRQETVRQALTMLLQCMKGG
jgi:PncC family amidohydrolase